MILPSIPFVVLLAGAASVTVTAWAGVNNRRPSPQALAVTAAAATSEKTACETFNRSLDDAMARLRSGAEVARLKGLQRDCSGVGTR